MTDKSNEALTPDEPSFPQALRSNAKFLMDCFDNLSRAEAQAVANKLNEAADALTSKSEMRTIKYERVKALDKRIAYGDDYAGDAWVRWTAVGQTPEDVTPTIEDGPPSHQVHGESLRLQRRHKGVSR